MYGSYNVRIILLVVLLCVVPTERTEYTEAYGLKLLESTERIDAARHTTEGTEMIACVAPPSAASEHSPLTSITRLNFNVYYTIETLTSITRLNINVHYTIKH